MTDITAAIGTPWLHKPWLGLVLTTGRSSITPFVVARLFKSLATLTLGSSKINQHRWRFHGSGVIAAPQIIGLISFCTGQCAFVFPIYVRKYRKQKTGLENLPQSFGVYTVSQSRSVVTSAENPAPDNSPQSIGELRNGHVANLQELYYTRLVRKMAWYKILIQVLIV